MDVDGDGKLDHPIHDDRGTAAPPAPRRAPPLFFSVGILLSFHGLLLLLLLLLLRTWCLVLSPWLLPPLKLFARWWCRSYFRTWAVAAAAAAAPPSRVSTETLSLDGPPPTSSPDVVAPRALTRCSTPVFPRPASPPSPLTAAAGRCWALSSAPT
ncbi:hypothetical protein VDGL01_07005 [Verticillium dahliae]